MDGEGGRLGRRLGELVEVEVKAWFCCMPPKLVSDSEEKEPKLESAPSSGISGRSTQAGLGGEAGFPLWLFLLGEEEEMEEDSPPPPD